MRRLFRGLKDTWDAQGCLGQGILLGLISAMIGIGAGALSIRFFPPEPVFGAQVAALTSIFATASPTVTVSQGASPTALSTPTTPTVAPTVTGVHATLTVAVPSATQSPTEAPGSPTATAPVASPGATSTDASLSSPTVVIVPSATSTAPPPSPTGVPAITLTQSPPPATEISPTPTVSLPGKTPSSASAPASPTSPPPTVVHTASATLPVSATSQVPIPVVTALPAVTTTVAGGAPRIPATVVWVIDAQTIEVSIAGRVYRVRYIGVDSPSAGLEPIGRLATARNRQLLAGQSVFLEGNSVEFDAYRQLLRYVFVDDLLVNAQLVRDGYARALLEPYALKYAQELREAELEAAQAGCQMWALGLEQAHSP